MELFNTNGHLTDEGLNAIINESLDELQRLEAAEHLSFCDECILRYTGMLENAVLVESNHSVLPAVKHKLRNKLIRFAFTKYGMAAACVAFALVISGSGIFSGFLDAVPKGTAKDAANGFVSGLSAIGTSISQFFSKNDVWAPKLPKVNIPKLPEVKIPKEAEQEKTPDAETDKDKKHKNEAQNEDDNKKDLTKADNPAKDTALDSKNAAKDIAQRKNPALEKLNPNSDNK